MKRYPKDIGRPRIPPFPNYIVMEDRSTGNNYVLTYTGSSGSLALSVSPTIPNRKDITYYGPYDGPYVADGMVRLYLFDGALAGENIASTDWPVQQGPVYARSGFTRRLLQITTPAGWVEGDAFTYTEIDIS